MSITIIVPNSLKDFLRGNNQASCAGKTIKECISDLDRKFPGFSGRVLNEKSEVNKSLMIFLDGQNILALNALDTSVKDGDEISIIPFAAGG